MKRIARRMNYSGIMLNSAGDEKFFASLISKGGASQFLYKARRAAQESQRDSGSKPWVGELGLYPMVVSPSPGLRSQYEIRQVNLSSLENPMKPRKPKLVKASTIKPVKTPRTPVSKKLLHRLRLNLKAAGLGPKPQKQDNVSSKSRNPHENRGTRKAKTMRPTKLLFRFCGIL